MAIKHVLSTLHEIESGNEIQSPFLRTLFVCDSLGEFGRLSVVDDGILGESSVHVDAGGVVDALLTRIFMMA